MQATCMKWKSQPTKTIIAKKPLRLISIVIHLSFHFTTTNMPINSTALPTRSPLFFLAYNYTFNFSASGRSSSTPCPCSRSALDPNARLINS